MQIGFELLSRSWKSWSASVPWLTELAGSVRTRQSRGFRAAVRARGRHGAAAGARRSPRRTHRVHIDDGAESERRPAGDDDGEWSSRYFHGTALPRSRRIRDRCAATASAVRRRIRDRWAATASAVRRARNSSDRIIAPRHPSRRRAKTRHHAALATEPRTRSNPLGWMRSQLIPPPRGEETSQPPPGRSPVRGKRDLTHAPQRANRGERNGSMTHPARSRHSPSSSA